MARKTQYGAAVGVAVAVAITISLAVVFLGAPRGPMDATPTRRPADAMQFGPETVEQNDQHSAEPQQADNSVPRSPSGDPVNYSSSVLTFTTEFPPHTAGDPIIEDLRRDSARYLSRIRANAEAAAAEARAAGAEFRPWSVDIVWRETARAGEIVSYSGEASEYTGGAHPMQLIDSHIANSRTGAEIEFDDMILPTRQSSPAFRVAVCEALKTVKTATVGSATIFDEPIVCVGPGENIRSNEAVVALAPSDRTDRFGGAYVSYDPYLVGAYVEGPYRLTVQQSVFAQDLRPQYRELFDGVAPELDN